jgi:Fe-S-cluster containining protein
MRMNPNKTIDNAKDPGSCARCGNCCKKGGPAIHREDKPLIERGDLLLKNLFTIRQGEQAYDNIKGIVEPQQADIIKIKSRKNTSTCTFYDEQSHACGIYRHRPVECRILKCWNTREIQNMYGKNRLDRFDIIGNVDGLWDLVSDHQRNCSFEGVPDFINDVKRTGKKDPLNEKKIRYIIRYDMEIRSLLTRKNKIDPDLLDFLFGRPFIDTLSAMGLTIRHQNEKIILSIDS